MWLDQYANTWLLNTFASSPWKRTKYNDTVKWLSHYRLETYRKGKVNNLLKYVSLRYLKTYKLSFCKMPWGSLVAQWQRICLPMKETWFNPWFRKIPFSAEQLSLCATTIEPMLCNKQKPPQWEAHAPQLRHSPYSPQLHKKFLCRKSLHSMQQLRPSTGKNKWIK